MRESIAGRKSEFPFLGCLPQNLGRHATRDVVIRDVEIPEGSRVIVSYGAANRDPEAFDAPDEYRVDREARRHVGFGHG